MMHVRYLLFEVAGDKYALALEGVAEIMDLPVLFPLPKTPSCYRGMMNCHGRPVPVLDLASFIGRLAGDGGGMVLVLAGKTVNLALLVGRVIGTVSGLKAHEPAEDGDSWLGMFLSGDAGTFRLIEPEKLLERLEREING